MKKLAASVALALALTVAAPARSADAATAFDYCNLVLVAFHERITGVPWNVFRATNFNLFGHWGVGCTVYQANTWPNQMFTCFVVDVNTNEVFGINCPTPP